MRLKGMPHRVLTPEAVAEIKRRWQDATGGLAYRKGFNPLLAILARDFRVARATVYAILIGKTHRNVDPGFGVEYYI